MRWLRGPGAQELASLSGQLPLLAAVSRLQLHPAFYPRKPYIQTAEPSGAGARAPDTRALSTALNYGGAAGATAGPGGAADFAPVLQLRWLLDAADGRPDALVCLPCVGLG